MEVLVTGGLGYLGQHVVRELQDRQGCEVTVLDSMLHAKSLNLGSKTTPYRLVVGDVRDAVSTEAVVRTADRVVHLAAVVGEAACGVDLRFSTSINVTGLRSVLDAARRSEKPLLYTSSCSVFGDAGGLVAESAPIVYESLPPYGRHKADGESIIASSGGPGVWIARLASLYGLSERPRTDLLVNLMCDEARNGRELHIHGDGGQYRPLINVADAAWIIADVVANGTPPVSTSILGIGRTSQNYTVAEVARLVAAKSGCNVSFATYSNPGDARSYRVSFSNQLSSTALVNSDWSLESSIEEMLGVDLTFEAPFYTNNERSVRRLLGIDL